MAVCEETDRLNYNPATDTYWLRHSWDSDRHICTAIGLAVAAVTNTRPTEFRPVYEEIDPNTLKQVCHSRVTGAPRECSARVTFTVNDCDVTVYATGQIELAPIDST